MNYSELFENEEVYRTGAGGEVYKDVDEQITTDSGLLLSSEEMKDLRYKKAQVVNPGTEVEAINEGDTVYYDKHSSHTMMINSEPYTIIQERNIVVVV